MLVFVLYLVVTLALAYHPEVSCDHDIIIVNNIYHAGCNKTASSSFQTVLCQSLMDAFEFIQKHDLCNITVHISPTGNVHNITKPVYIESANFELIGTRGPNSTMISCIAIEHDVFNASNYSIYSNSTSSVYLSNITFLNCLRPLGFDTIPLLRIEHVTMKKFTEAALEIFNCRNVYISNSHFHENHGTGRCKQLFRGNTGAVSIGYYDLQPKEKIKITVKHSNFTKNNATVQNGSYRSTSDAFFNGTLTGRAGGLGVFVYEDQTNVSILVDNCIFEENYVSNYGGGLYFVYSGNTSNIPKGNIEGNVTNCSFIRNSANLGGGGFIISIQTHGYNHHRLHFEDCHFENNTGNSGGGFYYYVIFNGGRGNSLTLKSTSFIHNSGHNFSEDFGSAFAASIYRDFDNSTSGFPKHVIENCSFIKNRGTNGIVSLGYLPFTFEGTNTFANNNGTAALRVIGTSATFNGTLIFINNSAKSEAALSLLSLGQIKLSNDTNVTFYNNNGRYGSSIYVDNFDQSEVFKTLSHNPHCLFLTDNYKDQKRSPTEWTKDKRINITFANNSALFGSAIYASSLIQCSWVSNEGPTHFNESEFPHWHMFHLRSNNNTANSNDIVTDATIVNTCSTMANNTINTWPGEMVNLHVISEDEFNQPTGSLIKVEDSNATSGIKFSPNSFYQTTSPFELKFQVLLSNKTAIKSQISFKPIIKKLQYSNGNSHAVNLNISLCPGGYFHNELGCLCETRSREIIQCLNKSTIIIEDGLWSTQINSDPNLVFFPCPPSYCQCYINSKIGIRECVHIYDNSNENIQCINNREGILCGECSANTTRTALLDTCDDKCTYRLPVWLLLLVVGLFDAIIIISIVLIDKPFPPVLYPVLFYVQIAPLIAVYMNPKIWLCAKYLYFIASVVGLYLPYDVCLENSEGIIPQLFRFIPSLIAMILIPSIIVINSLLVLHRKFESRSLKMHGIWTVCLLLYTSAVFNAVRSLHCYRIPTNNHSALHWYSNGSIECFSKSHWILSVFGILLLVLVFSFFIIAILQHYSKTMINSMRLITKFFEATVYPYGDPNAYGLMWANFDLISKLGLILVIEVFPGNKVFIVLALSVILGISSYFSLYKHRMANYVHRTVLSVLLIVVMLDITFKYTLTTEDHFSHNTTNLENAAFVIHIALYYFPMVLLALIGMLNASCKISKWKKKYYNAYHTELQPIKKNVDFYNSVTYSEIEISTET